MSSPVSLYDLSVPEFRTMLENLKKVLAKGEDYAKTHGISEEELLGSKLAPDMFDLKKQIQIATDHAKGAAGRLAGIDVPKFEDNEQTVAALQERLDNTIQFLDSVRPNQFNEAANRNIDLVFPWASYKFNGLTYLQRWALPNFFFHVTTAYDILRHKGVPLGKADFLGEISPVS